MTAIGSTLGLIGLPVTTPSALAPPSPLLADDVDVGTRDFRRIQFGADPVDAQVQLALQVVRGSGAAVMEVGIEPPPRKMISLQSVLASRVRNALKQLTANGDVRVASVVVAEDQGSQSAVVSVDYVNLRSLDRSTRTAVVSVPRVV